MTQIGLYLPQLLAESNAKLASRSFYAKTSSEPRVEILRRTLKFKMRIPQSNPESALVGVA